MLKLNGIVSVDCTEREAGNERNGVIALQLHPGPPFEMRFKNLPIRQG